MREKIKDKIKITHEACEIFWVLVYRVLMCFYKLWLVHKYLSRLGHEKGSKKTWSCENWEGNGDQREDQLDIGTWPVLITRIINIWLLKSHQNGNRENKKTWKLSIHLTYENSE